MEAFELPDGSIAESVSDVDKYLKRDNMALSSDFSSEYLKGVRERHEKVERAERFNDFVQQYKRKIWNG